METTHEILQSYLSITLSWPPLVFILTLVFYFKFAKSIRYFLENIGIKRVGPIEFQEPQPDNDMSEVDEKLKETEYTLSENQIKVVEAHIQDLSEEASKYKLDSEQKDQLINYLADRSQLFEFAYLNLFLVPNSKRALLWFFHNGKSTKDNFLFSLSQLVINPSEREAIFNALLKNELIVASSGMYSVSEKGIRFLRFIGVIS